MRLQGSWACASLGPAPESHQDRAGHQSIPPKATCPLQGVTQLCLALPLLCDGAGGPGAGACRKPFVCSFERGSLEPQGWASEPTYPGTHNLLCHLCSWGRGGAARGPGHWMEVSHRAPAPPVVPLCVLLLPSSHPVTATPHLQNWREWFMLGPALMFPLSGS